MLFLLCGVPASYFPRVMSIVKKRLANHDFLALPLKASVAGTYSINDAHIEQSLANLAKYIESDHTKVSEGVGLVTLLRPWEPDRGVDSFFPFLLPAIARTYERPRDSGVVVNQHATSIVQAAEGLLQPIKEIKGVLRDRLRRTPLLLPLRSFRADELTDLLQQTFRELPSAQNPKEFLRQACEKFENRFPFLRHDDGIQPAFMNDREMIFCAPGRHILHGRKTAIGEVSHTIRCFLNARLRLGGMIADGFHYDCVKRKGKHTGNNPNCHDALVDCEGSKYLNMYPNDFIRK